MDDAILKVEHVTKVFGGVKALTDLSLEFNKGEVIGLVGVNGAGKSTLLNLIWGTFAHDSGDIFINGEKIEKNSPEKAQELGISIIFQHRRLINHMSVAENIFLNRMPKKSTGIIDYEKMYHDASEWLELLNLNIDPHANIVDLSAEEKQLIEITKAVSKEANILLMDEPTTALRTQEVERLFEIVRNLKSKGTTIVFISHRLKEILTICDRIAILRDGRCVKEGKKDDFTLDDIIMHMTGQAQKSPRTADADSPASERGEILLEAKGVSLKNIEDVSFKLHKGEILGFVGLSGSGIDNMFSHLFGLEKRYDGEIIKEGRPIMIKRPLQAIAQGIGYVPEDRHLAGLFLDMMVSDNICIPKAQERLFIKTIRRRKESEYSSRYIGKLSIKAASEAAVIKNLSGGNQQKAVIAKWLLKGSKILIMNEPTAGIDVSAKSEVNLLIREISQEGKGVLYTSSDIDEVMEVSDRILVMYKGEIISEFSKEKFDNNMIYAAMNGKTEKAGA